MLKWLAVLVLVVVIGFVALLADEEFHVPATL
jgi:hypothetical protein